MVQAQASQASKLASSVSSLPDLSSFNSSLGSAAAAFNAMPANKADVLNAARDTINNLVNQVQNVSHRACPVFVSKLYNGVCCQFWVCSAAFKAMISMDSKVRRIHDKLQQISSI